MPTTVHRPLSTVHRTLVLFDFDGTLTKGDSFSRFLWSAKGFVGLLQSAPVLFWRWTVLFFSGKWSAGAAKSAILASCFAGQSKGRLYQLGERFCRKNLPGLMRPDMFDRLRTYRNEGAVLAVVSASVDIWLGPFCAVEKVTLICTEAAFENGIFTGHFATPNCKNAEKARRIKAVYDLAAFDKIIAFGNSAGDYAMFELAHEAWLCDRSGNFKPFK